MRTVELSDGKSIPVFGWGSGSGKQFNGGQHSIDAGVIALQAGILHIDTAQVYQTEREAGESIKKSGIPREKVWVTTKLSISSNTQCTPEDVRRSVQESLDKLGFIPDLFLLHNPHLVAKQEGKNIEDMYALVEDLVLDGTLKGCSLGISNFRPQDIEAVMKIARIKPVVNQIEYHPYVLTHIQPVLDSMEKYGIVVQSWAGLAPLLRHPTGGPLKPILERIASERSIDPVTVLYLWQLAKGIVIITTSGNPDNIRKIPKVEDMEPLSKEEVGEIERVGRGIYWRTSTNHMVEGFPPPTNLPSGI